MREIKPTLLSLLAVFAISVVGVSAQHKLAAPCADLTFDAPTYVAGGLGPRGLAAADLNGDGNADLVAANEASGTVRIQFGDGNGNFPTSQLFTAPGASSAAIADLNRDGNLDLVISERSINIVSVRLGLGGGTFGPAVETSVGSGPTAAVIADFNRDGNLDIATSNSGTSSVSLLLGNGTGAFPVVTDIQISQGSGAWGLVAADLNGDGNLDITLANRGSDNIGVMFGNGAGNFGMATVYATGSLATTVIATDFNGDGHLDLATANEGSNTVTVHFNNGLGAFPAAVALFSGVEPFFVASGDLDADGKADIVATNQGSNSVAVFRGNGDGTFAPRMDLAVNAAPRSLAVADLNNDGSADLSAGMNSGMIAVLLNGCSQNSAPTIESGTISRQQNAGSSNSTIATISDAEDKSSELSVTINGGSSASVNGVTVSNMTVDAAGNVNAAVSAACGADDAMFTLVVTDSGGLSATAKLNVDVIDETTPPVINNGESIPDMTVYLPLNSPDVSVAVMFDLPTATDNCTLSPTVTSSPESGSNFGVGRTTVTVTALDEVGNTATATFNVTVLFNFSGFLQPIDPFPALNVAKAGSAIPVKFSLSGDKGLKILAAGYPASSSIPCEDHEPGSNIPETVSTGDKTLSYDPVSDQYIYVWKTDKEWKKTCRILVVRLADGSEHYAKFRFR